VTPEPEPGRIVISGGNVHIGALAQGAGARASQVVSQQAADPDPDAAARRAELADLMRDLLDAIGHHAGELTDAVGAQATAGEAAAELGKDRPDVSRLRQLLGKLAILAGPVSEIAAAVITVERAITGTL
jgi:hypothetical protein